MGKFDVSIEDLWVKISACGLDFCEPCKERRRAIKVLREAATIDKEGAVHTPPDTKVKDG
jgi:hypothetical protein